MSVNVSSDRRGRPRRLLQAGVLHLLLAVCGLVVAFPFLWMLLTSLKTAREAAAFPPTLLPAVPQWGNYAEAWRAAPFARYLFNSAFISVSVTLSVMATALLAGYA